MQEPMKDLIEFAMGKARETILNEEEVIRVFFAKNKTNDIHIIMAPAFGADDDDRRYIPYLKMLFAILGIESYCMMSEVWMSKRETREGPPPSEDPNRTEALVAFAVQRSESGDGFATRFASAEITREPTAVGPIKWEDLTRIESKWSALLPPAGMPECPDVPWALEKLAEIAKQIGIEQFNITRAPGVSVH